MTNKAQNIVLAPFTVGIRYSWVCLIVTIITQNIVLTPFSVGTNYTEVYYSNIAQNIVLTFTLGIHYSEVGYNDQYSLEHCIKRLVIMTNIAQIIVLTPFTVDIHYNEVGYSDQYS